MTPDDRPAPTRRASSQDDAGRVCPYCRFALKEGGEITECGSCHAPHHTDCWTDNGGCAVLGCASAPIAGGPAPAPAPPASPPAPPQPAPPAGRRGRTPPPPPTAPAPSGSRSSRGLVAAVLLLALAIGGAAAAVVLTSKDPPSDAGPSASTQVSTDEPLPPPPPPPPENDTGLLPDTDRDTMAAEITDLLVAHHRAIVRGNYRAAWVTTSQRYRVKKTRELGGFGGWAAGQRATARYLDPTGLEVSIEDLAPRTGVATVKVTGMRWTDSSSRCVRDEGSRFEGITWAKYENGHWRYEPGYSMTPQRRAAWRPRATELLGVACVGIG